MGNLYDILKRNSENKTKDNNTAKIGNMAL